MPFSFIIIRLVMSCARAFFLCVLFATLALANSLSAQPPFKEQQLRKHLAVLASDSLEGRRSGEVGGRKAAAYIKQAFKKIGLIAIDSSKSYQQFFDFSEHALDTTKTGRTYTSNVIGFLKGTDPKLRDEIVVIGAHYDHLGFGGMHSLDTSTTKRIHYGADDNASGTAAVIELANYFAKKKTKRSLLFITFSGEEEGLFGSQYFTNNPLIPLNKVTAMINMDMIGRLSKDSVLIVEGMGTSPQFDSLMKALNSPKRFNLRLKPDGVGPSDHTSFYRKDIPVLFFFTGLHSDYHKSTDTRDKINYKGEKQIVEYIAKTVAALANNPKKPVFTKVPEDTTKKAASFKVYVGGVPDYGFDGTGVKISMITPNSPADKAGLKAEDIITKFGTFEIKNIYDYTNALSKHKPGDVVDVTVQRNGAALTLPVTLGSRSQGH